MTARGRIALIGVLLAVVGGTVYSRSLDAPFVFDDVHAIVENPHIRRLWPIEALPQSALAGRPVVSFTFAVNYQFGGLDPRGYRAVNIAIHMVCGLLVFGLLRRTLRSTGAAALAALAWLVHPLCTESVAYVVQRTESLMAMFYLLTLYASVRYWQEGRRGWAVCAVGACALGMGCKEPMVSAPLVVLLLDRALFAGSFADAWRERRRFYLALAATWLVLLVLMGGNPRSESAGFGIGDSAWHYLLTEAKAIVHYVRLCFVPHPLSVSHPWPLATSIGEVWWQGVIVLALVALTFVWLRLKPAAGAVAFGFFAVLAPTSSFIPLANEAVSERRMYLPLVAVLALIAAVLERLLCDAPAKRRVAVAAALVIAVAMSCMTWSRLGDYRSQRAQWLSVLEVYPDDPNAHVGLGVLAARRGDLAAAVAHYRRALDVRPGMVAVRANYGAALGDLGRDDEAIEQLRLAVKMDPDRGVARYNLAVRLFQRGEQSEAMAHFAGALRAGRLPVAAYLAIGQVMFDAQRYDEAADAFVAAAELQPDHAEAHFKCALSRSRAGQLEQSVTSYRKALSLRPAWPEAHNNLGVALARLGRVGEARDHFAEAVRLAPDYGDAVDNLRRAEATLRAAEP